MQSCRICGNQAGNRSLMVPEMMFGTRIEFEYIECARCGCLQISDIPADMAEHYPSAYYSYSDPSKPIRFRALKTILKRQRLHRLLDKSRSPVGRLMARFPGPAYLTDWFRRADINADTPILEAGCGNGALLMEMAGEGFTSLTGVDPYVEKEIRYPNGVVILKQTLEQTTGRFGFAMLHHAFEHLPDPLSALRALARLLGPGGKLLLRIPIASAAWKEYGKDWVQLDAPRHFFLHTERSLSELAAKAGFKVTGIAYDSTAFQFWGSEQYRMGIPLKDPRSHAVAPGDSPFPPERIQEFEEKARQWNGKGTGDQACFFLEAV